MSTSRLDKKDSLDTLRQYYSTGYATKEKTIQNALRAYQSYLDEIESPLLRDEAVVVLGDDRRYYGET